MKYLVRSIALVLCICTLVGCSEAAGEAEVSLEAVIDTVSRSTRSSDTEVSRNITPSTYKIALTYFALIRKDGAVIPIIDEDAPEVYDFSGRFTTPLLLGRKRIPVGEYTAKRCDSPTWRWILSARSVCRPGHLMPTQRN